MTVLSAYLGSLAGFIPRVYTHYIATGLFIIFGLRLLRVGRQQPHDTENAEIPMPDMISILGALQEGYYMSEDEGAEELEEVTQELKAKEDKLSSKGRIPAVLGSAPFCVVLSSMLVCLSFTDIS
jgi:putative Ca2+/H+ antiporter (TMEM165/GDT1 family)